MARQLTEAEKIFMDRDGMSRREAANHRNEIRRNILSAIEEGASYSDIEDMLSYDECLEMDYLLDFI